MSQGRRGSPGMVGGRYLVTGAAGGIGARTCRALRAAGAFVVAADLDVSGLDGADRAVRLDVTDDGAVRSVLEQVGDLDGLVLSHGVTSLGRAVDTPMAAIDRVLDVNLRGAILVTQVALPGLVRRRGRIGVLSSVSGFAPLVHRTAYSASKHGIHGYFESLRAEMRDIGVSVTIVAPSFVATGIEQRAAHRASDASGRWSTTGRVLEPDDVAMAIVTGMEQRHDLVLPSTTARVAYALSRVAPATYARMMRRRVLRGS